MYIEQPAEEDAEGPPLKPFFVTYGPLRCGKLRYKFPAHPTRHIMVRQFEMNAALRFRLET